MCEKIDMGIIEKVKGREILDSRGNPTVEVDLIVGDKCFRASVPSGASTGTYEAVELRDGGERYFGKGVMRAVKNINEIIGPKIIGLDCRNQREIDTLICQMDGTENKKVLGTNAILAVSMALVKAGAEAMGIPLYKYIGKLAESEAVTLPIPQMNVINGGRHAGFSDDIQEYMIIPIGACSFEEGLRICVEVYFKLKDLLEAKFGAGGIHLGDEGGFVPPTNGVEERLSLITEAIKLLGYEKKIALAIDAASSEFYHDNKYTISGKAYTSEELVSFYEGLIERFNCVSIEDGMAEDDWQGWVLLNERIGKRVQLIGDDLFVTNIKRVNQGIEVGAANSVLLKINQIGTVTETIETWRVAKKVGWNVVVSHRSGETEDTFIANLVVGLDAKQSKFGAPARSERNCKYNELLRIEEELGEKAVYGGRISF